jgi:hypothetical protein
VYSATPDPEGFWGYADAEFQDFDATEFGDREMAKLMEDDEEKQDAYEDDGCEEDVESVAVDEDCDGGEEGC